MKNYILIILTVILSSIGNIYANEINDPELRVQLPWTHSSQFTGFYVAQLRKHFENEGLRIKLIEGGPKINAATELQEGRADIAIVGLGTAWETSKAGKEITNISQIVTGSGLVVVCNIGSGVYGPKDVIGKKIGIWGVGDKSVVETMLKKLSIPIDSVQFIIQKPDGSDLVNKNASCVTAMTFDEYLRIIDQGIPYSDLIVIDPNKLGIPVLLDGVYVSTARLQSEHFRNQMVGFIRALRNGWRETRIAPTISLEAVKALSKNFNREQELKSLEVMLTIIPSDSSKFGLLDLDTFEKESERYKSEDKNKYYPKDIWTHQIWNQLQRDDGKLHPLTVSTKYYVNHISHLLFFKILVYFGVFTYALSGVLEAINRNYDLWGRLILAFLSGIGGGTLRDLIIGGDRLPFYYVKDVTYPLGIFLVVFFSSVVVGFYPHAHKSDAFKKIKKYSDVFGFSALAVAGTIYSISSDLPWFWAPALAAISCAGGGVLRDIVVNQEPMTFKGVIYEEAAIFGGIFIVIGLMLSNNYEHSPITVFVTIFGGLALIVFLRIIVYHYGLKYPKSLGGTDIQH